MNIFSLPDVMSNINDVLSILFSSNFSDAKKVKELDPLFPKINVTVYVHLLKVTDKLIYKESNPSSLFSLLFTLL